MKNRKQNRGMTLIEIIVVISILSLIMAAVGVSVMNAFDKAHVNTAKLDLGNLRTALKSYYLQNHRFPNEQQGFETLVQEGILDVPPVDPWNHPYVYSLENGKPVIKCLGRDGKVGGEELDTDLVSDMKGEKKEPSSLSLRDHPVAHGNL
jgi:general secretion pathway protein G